MKIRLVLVLALLMLPLAAAPGAAQSADALLFARAVEHRAATPPPLRLVERAALVPLDHLAAASRVAPEQLEEIRLWNRAENLPVKNGFLRSLAAPQAVELAPSLQGRLGSPAGHDGGLVARTAAGDLVWGAEVRVDDAWRLRLRLADAQLPPGAQLWVYGADGQAVGPFGQELRAPDGTLWTPSVDGESIRVEVMLPAAELAAVGGGSFVVDGVMEQFPLGSKGEPLTDLSLAPRLGECIVDAQCIGNATFNGIDLVQQAVGLIVFVDGGTSFICSGGLQADTLGSNTPYMLTANHCFNSQASASSVEVYWDYYTSSCNGPDPSLGSLPRSMGSNLLATGASSDFTLIQLFGIPANRTFLGWNADPGVLPNGTLLHRLSHPNGEPQRYSSNRVDVNTPVCGGAPRPNFLYEKYTASLGDQGGTFGGSSGSPVILRGAGGAAIWTVGQLTGGCGPPSTVDDGCDYINNSEVDGAFSATFPNVQQWLAPSGGGTMCVPDETTLCLFNGRFSVTVFFRRPGNPSEGFATVDERQNQWGTFFFFANSNIPNAMVTMGPRPNGFLAVQIPPLQAAELEVTIFDHDNEITQVYTKPQDNLELIIDPAAFPQ